MEGKKLVAVLLLCALVLEVMQLPVEAAAPAKGGPPTKPGPATPAEGGKPGPATPAQGGKPATRQLLSKKKDSKKEDCSDKSNFVTKSACKIKSALTKKDDKKGDKKDKKDKKGHH